MAGFRSSDNKCTHVCGCGPLCGSDCRLPPTDCGHHMLLPGVPRGMCPALGQGHASLNRTPHLKPILSQSSAGVSAGKHPWSVHVCSPNGVQKPEGLLSSIGLAHNYQTHNSISSSCFKRIARESHAHSHLPKEQPRPAPACLPASALAHQPSLSAPVPSQYLPALKSTNHQPCIIISSASHPPKKIR